MFHWILNIACAQMFQKTQNSVKKTQRKDQCGIGKTLNIKTMLEEQLKKVIFVLSV